MLEITISPVILQSRTSPHLLRTCREATRNWKNQASIRAIYLTDDDLLGADDEEAKETTSITPTIQDVIDAFKDPKLRTLAPPDRETRLS
jgi:hypothetical protein